MRVKPAVLAALLAAAVAAAPARADAPWAPPSTIPGAVAVTGAVFTPTGQGAIATLVPTGAAGFPDTMVTPIDSDGTLGAGHRLHLSGPALATYGNGGI